MSDHVKPRDPLADSDESQSIPPSPDPNLESPELTESLIEPALSAGEDARIGWSQREDGWTPDRIRTFLATLACCGVVTDAAAAAGMSVRSAYALRSSAKGRAFHLAWRAALLVARNRLSDELMSRALNGCVERVYRNGELYQERHRHDNRLLLSVLARLDGKLRDSCYDNAAAKVASEFESFVDTICSDRNEVGDLLRKIDARSYRQREEVALIERDVDGLPEDDDEEDDEDGDGETSAHEPDLDRLIGLLTS
ncbi:MAG: hypothetical protein ACT4OE_00995 [Sphingosinicella sp.]